MIVISGESTSDTNFRKDHTTPDEGKTSDITNIFKQNVADGLANHVSTWIDSSLTNNNVRDFKTVAEKYLNETQINSNQDVNPLHVKEILDSCKILIGKVHSALVNFNRTLIASFEELGCYDSSMEINDVCLDQMHLHDIFPADFRLISLFENACRKLAREYTILNQDIVWEQTYYANQIKAQIVKEYTSEMSRYTKVGPCSNDVLKAIHVALKKRCMLAFQNVFSSPEGKNKFVRETVGNKLETELDNRFYAWIGSANHTNLTKYCKAVTTEIEQLSINFNTQIPKKLKSTPSLQTYKTLKEDLDAFLKLEVASTIMLDSCKENWYSWKILQTTVDQYIMNTSPDIYEHYICEATKLVKCTFPLAVDQCMQERSYSVPWNIKNFLKTTFHQNLSKQISKYQTILPRNRWNWFQEQVNHRCTEDLEKLQDVLWKFRLGIENHLRLSNYFLTASITKIEDRWVMELEKVEMALKDHVHLKYVANNISRAMAAHAIDSNKDFVIAEKCAPELIREQLMQFLAAKLQIYSRVYSHKTYQGVRANLLNTCNNILDIIDFYGRKWSKEVITQELESFTGYYDNINHSQFRTVASKISDWENYYITLYRKRISHVLNKNEYGLSESQRLKKHEHVPKEILERMKDKMEYYIGNDIAFIEERLEQFSSRIGQHWLEVYLELDAYNK